jgi:hypothetical protein
MTKSVCAQRSCRIFRRRAPTGDETGERRHRDNDEQDRADGRRIPRFHLKQ